MNRFFYPHLALENIRKNRSIYRPYLLAGSLIVLLFYALRSIVIMLKDSGAKGGEHMSIILGLSSWVCGMLSLVVLFYINSFIMKRRKREFGLYSILGMEKRHIAKVMAWEVLFTGAFCILGGILGGALFSQALFLLLLKLASLPVLLSFQIPTQAVLVTLALFGAGFLVVLLYDIYAVHRTDPIALLSSQKEGEREPKARWLLTLVGLITLGGGYVLSCTVQRPSDALLLFFPAVLLVIIGTYCLFIAGSIVLLKALKGNKKFYYQPQNFISVSGMLYRMKQNATGLANICILSTCVLVTLSSTICLFIGEEEVLRGRFPREVETSCILEGPSDPQMLRDTSAEHAKEYGLILKDPMGYTNFSFPSVRNGDRFSMERLYGNNTVAVECLLLEEYNQLAGAQYTLGKDEVLLHLTEGPLSGEALTLGGKTYRVAKTIPDPEYQGTVGDGGMAVVVLRDYDALEALREEYTLQSGNKNRDIYFTYRYDLFGDETNRPAFYATLRGALNEMVPRVATVDNIDSARNDFYQLYGTLLFVGIFFVSLFLIAAVLIIYYKQITEGFDDHDRFQIMQKVGLSDQEVRGTIGKQVLLVFFLPLGMAVLHISVAFPVLCKLLAAFQMTNTTLFFYCTVGSVLAFALLYWAVYRLTARTYYRIVQAV